MEPDERNPLADFDAAAFEAELDKLLQSPATADWNPDPDPVPAAPDPDTPLRKILPARTATVLGDEFGLATLGDLLHFYPRKYIVFGRKDSFAGLAEGDMVSVCADVVRVQRIDNRSRPGHRHEVTLADDDGHEMKATFFNQRGWIDRTLVPGTSAIFSGKVSDYLGHLQLAHPSILKEHDSEHPLGLNRIIPVYPATMGLSSERTRKAIDTALVQIPADPLPAAIRAREELTDLATALQGIHRPATQADLDLARSRLRFDEALMFQLKLAKRRAAINAIGADMFTTQPGGLVERFDAGLPFALTGAQLEAGREIAADLAAGRPMTRLLQGDVGSGKTVVALRAMLTVVESGAQAVLMAPTEVLALQHARTIDALLGPLGQGGQLGGDLDSTNVVVLTGSTPAARRRQAHEAIASGEAGIIIGTHALLYDVPFDHLGLVVVDEQHRFGVEQRAELQTKEGTPVHTLIMSATPIPRTYALTLFGDMSVSTLGELPAGRRPITTSAVEPKWAGLMWRRVRENVAAGHQVYVVFPRIGGGQDTDDLDTSAPVGSAETSDSAPKSNGKALLELGPKLAAGPLDGLRVEMLHGRMSAEMKDSVMRRFVEGRIDVLLATTVIEVGVDVPNATVMVILDADRFGVAQLHQLRGRVGRGAAESRCFLATDVDATHPAYARIQKLVDTHDGFALAEFDLATRREGQMFGDRQHGRSELRLLELTNPDHQAVMLRARLAATEIVAIDPELNDHPVLAANYEAFVRIHDTEYLNKG